MSRAPGRKEKPVGEMQLTPNSIPEPLRSPSLRPNAICFGLAAILAFFLYCASPVSPQDTNRIVSTKSGKVRGVVRRFGGAEFLGIPYAQPPTGDRRWREPVPVQPWKDVRDASNFGAPCAQPVLGDWNKSAAEYGKEDCLFLNVLTPVWPAKGRLPVMFWLHGGGNEGGTASSALYKDGTLVSHGIVLVTVNYRLGVFGFFAHPGLTRESRREASGNYGLMDQLAALGWVLENIAKFGGDPKNITVFGQSAGSQDAGLLMTSPLAKGLFQKVVGESGSALDPNIPSLSVSEERGRKIAALLKAPSGEGAVKYLRGLTAEELLKGLEDRDSEQPPRVGPNIDGWVLPRLAAEVFAAGQQMPIPMIIGSTTREFGMPGGPNEVRKMIEGVSGNLAPKALELYGLADGGQGTTDPLYGPVANQWFADFIFRCPVTTQAEWHNAAKHPTYEYQFEHAVPGQEAEGAVHSADLPYVFGYYPKAGNISGKFGDTDYKLAQLIESYWTNFAKRGNPNSEGLPHWPEYDGSQAFIEFTQDGAVVAQTGGLRRAQCDFHRELLERRLSQNQ
jgi:para-nitrobenzyl esterase